MKLLNFLFSKWKKKQVYVLYTSQQRILLDFGTWTVEICSTLMFPKSNFRIAQLKRDCVHSVGQMPHFFVFFPRSSPCFFTLFPQLECFHKLFVLNRSTSWMKHSLGFNSGFSINVNFLSKAHPVQTKSAVAVAVWNALLGWAGVSALHPHVVPEAFRKFPDCCLISSVVLASLCCFQMLLEASRPFRAKKDPWNSHACI